MKSCNGICYRVGDLVALRLDTLESATDISEPLRGWIAEYGIDLFYISKVSGESEETPVYYLEVQHSHQQSPDGFYHEELRLVTSKNQEWDT